MTPKSGRRIAWLSFVLGIVVSVLGNIGHAASDGMKPGEWAGAAFWPTALMLSIEILTRVRWQLGKVWSVARIAGLVAVATVAAVLSYRHLAGLMTYWGEDRWNAHLGPFAVDGLMLLAATALLSISKEDASTPVEQPPVTEEKVVEQTIAPASKPKIQPKRIEPVSQIDGDAKRAAAWQAWTTAPHDSKPTVTQLAELSGLPRSTAGKLAKDWRELNGAAR